jgi:hypothetical protein
VAKFSDLYDSPYLNAGDLQPTGKRFPALIHAVDIEEIGRAREKKYCLTLVSATGKQWPKRLPLNATRSRVLKEGCGDDTASCLGRAIELWAEPVLFGRETVLGIKLAVVPAEHAAPGEPGPKSGNGQAHPELDDEIPF